MALSTYLIGILSTPTISVLMKLGGSGYLSKGLQAKIVGGSFIVPLFETLVFQYAVIKIVGNFGFFKERKYLITIISALLLSIYHPYSYLYILSTFLIGIVLAYSYLLYDYKEKHPFWVVFLIHCLRNTLSTISFVLFNI